MLEFIRTHQRLMQFLLLLIIFPSFAFFGIESYLRMNDKEPEVAKVAGKSITQREWDAAQARQMERFQQMFGEQFNPAMLDTPEARQGVLENLIAQRAMSAHVIENLRQVAKEAAGGKKKPKANPPPGFVMWTRETFQKLIDSRPEALLSRFQVSHGMLLSVLSRPNGVKAMKKLIRDSHSSPAMKKNLRKTAFELFRSLYERKLVEFYLSPDFREPQIRVLADLQEDFSLHQTLALYLIDTLSLLDPTSEEYALDVLTLAESILESPDLILRRQLDRLKTEKMAELKAQGVEYEQRIEELEKLEHPKPKRDFIYESFNRFREIGRAHV